ncbi:unnamed protein product [Gemmataceae bacterium]|nr:unnamed protein product [Gemmataceae bacterium]VTT98889.1 unnamed protein product [Gemmataceae bacterium]
MKRQRRPKPTTPPPPWTVDPRAADPAKYGPPDEVAEVPKVYACRCTAEQRAAEGVPNGHTGMCQLRNYPIRWKPNP